MQEAACLLLVNLLYNNQKMWRSETFWINENYLILAFDVILQ